MHSVTSVIDHRKLPPNGGATLPILDPSNGQQVGVLHEADAAEVDRAVASARRAFREGPWPRLSVAERQAALRRLGDLVEANLDELATLEVLNAGLPYRHFRTTQGPRAAYNFRFFAEYIGQRADPTYRQEPGILTLVSHEPRGVAALISPWNAPLALSTMKVAAAIAFGNTCVLKPSEQTPLSLVRFLELVEEAGIPPGVVNMVNGSGAVTGRALVEHPHVDVISFTGGTETGRAVLASAAKNIKPAAVELGGKSAFILFADADLSRALDATLAGIYSNNGQACLAGSRILVQRRIADRFLADFADRTKRIRVGHPLDEATEIGPLASERHRDRVLSYADVARAEGGTVIAGGNPHPDFNAGFYMEPTAVLAPDGKGRVSQEEIFGPFATIVLFEDEAEAVAIANDSPFGLAGYLWTEHVGRAHRVAAAMRTGTVWVNTPMIRDLRSGFGGWGESGIGREGGNGALATFCHEKAVLLGLEDRPIQKFGAG